MGRGGGDQESSGGTDLGTGVSRERVPHEDSRDKKHIVDMPESSLRHYCFSCSFVNSNWMGLQGTNTNRDHH